MYLKGDRERIENQKRLAGLLELKHDVPCFAYHLLALIVRSTHEDGKHVMNHFVFVEGQSCFHDR